RLESGLTLTLATWRKRSIALRATGWVMKMRGRIRSSTARRRRRHRPRPASRPGCGWWRRARRAPSGCRARAPARRGARWNRRARRPRRPRAAVRGSAPGWRCAGPAGGQPALAVPHPGAAGPPADARRVSAETGMLAPDLVGHGDRLDNQRACLQQLEADMVERPLDLDRTADDGFRLAHHAAER